MFPTREAHEPGRFNRLVEREVLRLGSIKSLYAESFFTREEFDHASAWGRIPSASSATTPMTARRTCSTSVC